ncbi:hypothetical protein FNF27_04623 [Cafeteria roenbergensis]|uniref:Uncharacterized protein n=1 Tax=Cafeteria roenbergensis TaxID=33653 RepID=A0A5A8E819_CAFRO|nr:hypothetical protein FNF27_04623 [Cafeteria roenbergensis]
MSAASPVGGKWSDEEDGSLRQGVQTLGAKNWKRISEEYLQGRRTDVQCLHRWQKVLRPGLVKGPWTTEEDQVIVNCINAGITKWSEISERIPGRIGKQCRERWFNHLDPSIKKDPWSAEEDRILEEAQCSIGNKWCEIAKLLPGRSENSVKNRWNSAMRRKRHAERLKAQGAPDEAVRAAAKVPRAKTSGKRRHSGSGSATQSRRVTTTEDGSEPLPSVYPSAGGAGGAATPDTDGLGAPPSLAPSAGGTGAHGQGQLADSATAAAAEAMGAGPSVRASLLAAAVFGPSSGAAGGPAGGASDPFSAPVLRPAIQAAAYGVPSGYASGGSGPQMVAASPRSGDVDSDGEDDDASSFSGARHAHAGSRSGIEPGDDDGRRRRRRR